MSTPTATQLDLFKRYLDISADVNTDLVNACLTAAFNLCEQYTSLKLAVEDVAVNTTGEGGTIWLPPSLPIVAVTQLKINDVTIPASTSYTSNGYYIDGRMLKLRGYTFDGWIEIQYTAGYSEDTLPADLLLSCFEVAAGIYETKNNIRVQTRNLKDENITFTSSVITASVKDVWDKYKVVRI